MMSQPAPQPVVGDDGELLEIDPNVDPDAYADYVERQAAQRSALDDRDFRQLLKDSALVLLLVGAVVLALILVSSGT